MKPPASPRTMHSPRQRLYYFRHGETLWSLTGQHTGTTDIPLTIHGEAQARGLAPWVGAIAVSHVLTSPRARARSTCELAGVGGRAEIEPDLAEWNYGDYEGRRSIDIREERPGWNIFRDGCPNGESPGQVVERIDRLIVRLRELQGDIALFSHGQFGAVFGARWIGLSVIEAQHFELGPASMSLLSWDRDHPDVPVLMLWNATAEVPGTLPPPSTATRASGG